MRRDGSKAGCVFDRQAGWRLAVAMHSFILSLRAPAMNTVSRTARDYGANAVCSSIALKVALQSGLNSHRSSARAHRLRLSHSDCDS